MSDDALPLPWVSHPPRCVHDRGLHEECPSCGRIRAHPPVPAPKADAVNHPRHYTSHPSGVECITITRHMNFNIGNAVKYLWRAGLKSDTVEDLEKAAWYIADEIKKRKSDP